MPGDIHPNVKNISLYTRWSQPLCRAGLKSEQGRRNYDRSAQGPPSDKRDHRQWLPAARAPKTSLWAAPRAPPQLLSGRGWLMGPRLPLRRSSTPSGTKHTPEPLHGQALPPPSQTLLPWAFPACPTPSPRAVSQGPDALHHDVYSLVFISTHTKDTSAPRNRQQEASSRAQVI